MSLRMLAVALCVGSSTAAGLSKDFPPGWNGLALTPPLGWRSWNAFGNRITQDMMLEAAQAMVAKNRTVEGQSGLVSLCDLGYCSVGVDEGWEGCGLGVDGTQHDAKGNPTIASSFPDTGGMVQAIHKLGLQAGWYLNGCKCGEKVEKTINYEGDIRDLHDFQFDGVKSDDCGSQRNSTLYAELMRESGKNYTIENCHWGGCTDSDDSSCPTHDWCPFNFFRTSGDINSGYDSWMHNLGTTTKFQDFEKPLSQPGCWAYPDMLEVGRVAEPPDAPGTFYTWNRAHFGAWCVTSSPLILGMELTDAKLGPVLDIIGNQEAIKVNQQWSGHPGMLVETVYAPPTPFTPGGAVVPSTSTDDFFLEWGGMGVLMSEGKADKDTSGDHAIRTGSRGQVGKILIGTGLLGGPGHKIDSLTMSFRYCTGYTPGDKAPTVRVLLLDVATGEELKELFVSPPLDGYPFDDTFTGYSPPIEVSATGLNVPNDVVVIPALEITNNERTLHIPLDDLAAGFNLKVTWTSSSSAEAEAEAESSSAASSSSSSLGLPFGLGQLWAKKQPNGASAALLINFSPKELAYELLLSKLNLTATTYKARDLWAHKDLGSVTKAMTLTVAPYDSAFLLFSE